MNWETLYWREPLWLLLISWPFLLWLAQKLWRQKQQNQFAEPTLWPWIKVPEKETLSSKKPITAWGSKIGKKLFSPKSLFILAWIAWLIALAGPRTLQPTSQQMHRNGVDILVVMDLSRSMLAEDISPNRFAFAKAWVSALSQQLAPTDRIGLMGYQAYPHLILPLTQDKTLFNHFLQLTEIDKMPTRGSRLKVALVEAHRLLTQTANQPAIILVFTNGQPDAWQLQPKVTGFNKLAKLAAEQKIDTYIYGVGLPKFTTLPDLTSNLTPEQSRLHSRTNTQKKLRVNGLLVQTRLETAFLRKVAQQIGADYTTLSFDADLLESLQQKIINKAKPQTVDIEKMQWQDHSQAFIWLGFVALLLAWFRFKLPFKTSSNIAKSHTGLGILVFCSAYFLFSVQDAIAADLNWKQISKAKLAEQAYQNQDYELAMQYFNEIGGYLGKFNAGNAAYRLKDWESAVYYFRQAFQAAETQQQRAQSLYNLGNSYYQTKLFAKAIEAYQGALLYQTNYPKAKQNLTLAQKHLTLKHPPKKQKTQKNKEQQEMAFYGGQKPSGNPEATKGGMGDLETLTNAHSEFTLPQSETPTDYALPNNWTEQSITALKTPKEKTGNHSAQIILHKQQQQNIIADLKRQLRPLQDKQKRLLKKFFEREEGYMAQQKTAHQMPGIQPW